MKHCVFSHRYTVERFVTGLKPVVPLNPSELRKPLGPGYRRGWYAWQSLGDRKGDCDVGSVNSSMIEVMNTIYDEIRAEITRKQTFEEFCKFLEAKYHNTGHMVVSKACSSTFNPTNNNGMGPMAFSEVSARDPIFWRWHGHIEETMQTFRDKQLPL